MRFILKGKFGFTLAEVLITLSVIGVVAALTIPPLVQSYKKHVVETRLKKFYSVINQAITLAELDYGPRETWIGLAKGGVADRTEWVNKYFVPYMKTIKVDTVDWNNGPVIYFADGSALEAAHETSLNDWVFWPSAHDRFKKAAKRGKDGFTFYYSPSTVKYSSGWLSYYHNGFEPYIFNWDGTKEDLYKKCGESTYSTYYGNLCTKIIQLNGWKIPDDYPWKF